MADLRDLAMLAARAAGPDHIIPMVRDSIDEWLETKSKRCEDKLFIMLGLGIASLTDTELESMSDMLQEINDALGIMERLKGGN